MSGGALRRLQSFASICSAKEHIVHVTIEREKARALLSNTLESQRIMRTISLPRSGIRQIATVCCHEVAHPWLGHSNFRHHNVVHLQPSALWRCCRLRCRGTTLWCPFFFRAFHGCATSWQHTVATYLVPLRGEEMTPHAHVTS